ncbi:MAG: TonB-dependent receptor [Cyclobacteriaceae bacterium]|nr:TonB-dependent receptor [Cyclobacteriaceae bacterium]
MNKSINYIYIISLVLMLQWVCTISHAQTNLHRIQLKDALTGESVVGAGFTYGGKHGISDTNGYIEISYREGAELHLSHLSYGQWHVKETAVKHALELGFILWKEIPKTLLPVTIISIREPGNSTLNIDAHERLSHDAGAVLNQNPMFSSIRKSASYGFDPVFRGFKYEQLNIVIDGVQTAIAACPNRMDPPTSQVALNMMENIHIYKGPHALRYGNSFGATINFVPVSPGFSEKQDFFGRASSLYESNGNVLKNELNLGLRNRNYEFNIYGAYAQGSDYKDGEGVKIPANFLRYSLGASLAWKPGQNDMLQLSVNRNIAQNTDFPALPMDLIRDDTWLINAKYDLEFKSRHLKKWSSAAFGSFVDHLMSNALREISPRMVNAKTPATTEAFGGRTELSFVFNSSEMYTGLDTRSESASGIREREFLMGPNAGNILYDNAWQDSRITKTAVFNEFHLFSGKTRWVMSGRLELNHARLADPQTEYQQHNETENIMQVNPSVSTGVSRELSHNLQMGFWLGRSQRSGSLTERFINYFPVGLDPYEMLGNADLKPEVNHQADLNMSFKTANSYLEVNLFAAYLNDFILGSIDPEITPRFPSSPGVRVFGNLDRALLSGFEFSWRQTFTDYLEQNLMLAYTYGKDLVQNEALPEISPMDLRYRLTAKFFNNKLGISGAFRRVIAQNRYNQSFGERRTPGFSLLDFDALYRFNSWLRASAGVNNILNMHYYEHLNRSFAAQRERPIFAPGRNVFVSLSIDLR